MLIKATLGTLLFILVAVIAASYYVNKEGFDDITNSLASATNTITPSPIPAPIPAPTPVPTPAPTPATSSIPVPTTSSSSTPQRNDIVPEVSISGSGYDAMTLQQRMELLKDIQKVVRNEILASRNTKPLDVRPLGITETDSTAQGKEYSDSCYKDTEYRCPKNPDGSCPPVPDMTQYIKKDAIPCWGCSLDY